MNPPPTARQCSSGNALPLFSSRPVSVSPRAVIIFPAIGDVDESIIELVDRIKNHRFSIRQARLPSKCADDRRERFRQLCDLPNRSPSRVSTICKPPDQYPQMLCLGETEGANGGVHRRSQEQVLTHARIAGLGQARDGRWMFWCFAGCCKWCRSHDNRFRAERHNRNRRLGQKEPALSGHN